jgi:hypothetical protein
MNKERKTKDLRDCRNCKTLPIGDVLTFSEITI